MKKERTINELLKLMLDNQNFFSCGLCGWANTMYHGDKINKTEYMKLRGYIDLNEPFTFHKLRNPDSRFYWKIGELAPRVRWIKKHIKRTGK
jgi:hypothetical protein